MGKGASHKRKTNPKKWLELSLCTILIKCDKLWRSGKAKGVWASGGW